MTIEFDDKGKFFTDIISKTPVPVMIQTVAQRIHGTIHVSPDRRLKDELNLPEKFIAITEAVIFSPDGKILYHSKFLAVQRDEIVWVMPDSEATDLEKENAK